MTAAAKPQNVAVWFEIPAADFERAVGFYERVFDTRLIRDKFDGGDMAIFPHEKQSVSGAVMKAESYRPTGDGSVVYLSAGEDLSPVLERATGAGGKIAIPKTELPDGLGFFAQLIDTEGNRVGLHSVR